MNKLTEAQEKFVTELATKMAAQDNRATQRPLFIIMETEKVWRGNEGSETERKSPDAGGHDGLCKNCTLILEETGELSNAYCADCDSECFWTYDLEEQPDLNAGVFFTAEACDRHIKQNHYHYHNPKSYAICGAWRNPEMAEVMKIIFALAGINLPIQYT